MSDRARKGAGVPVLHLRGAGCPPCCNLGSWPLCSAGHTAARVQAGPDGAAAGDIQAKIDIPASTLSRREGTFIYHGVFPGPRALTDYLWEDCCTGGKGTCC